MSRSRRSVLGLFAAMPFGMVAFLTGCTPGISAITVEALTTPPIPAQTGNDRVSLSEGTGIGLKILAFTGDPSARDSNGNRPNAINPDHVKITSDNPSIARIVHVESGTYIVTGTAPGTTKLIVNSTDTNGFVELTVNVVAQM